MTKFRDLPIASRVMAIAISVLVSVMLLMAAAIIIGLLANAIGKVYS